MSGTGNIKLQAHKVGLNQYRNEYIDFEVKQIRKEHQLEQRAKELKAHNINNLYGLIPISRNTDRQSSLFPHISVDVLSPLRNKFRSSIERYADNKSMSPNQSQAIDQGFIIQDLKQKKTNRFDKIMSSYEANQNRNYDRQGEYNDNERKDTITINETIQESPQQRSHFKTRNNATFQIHNDPNSVHQSLMSLSMNEGRRNDSVSLSNQFNQNLKENIKLSKIRKQNKSISSRFDQQSTVFSTQSPQSNYRVKQAYGVKDSPNNQAILEAKENRQKLRHLLVECIDFENQTKDHSLDLDKEVVRYQQYMTTFKNYIDFKQQNPYSEQDEDYDRAIASSQQRRDERNKLIKLIDRRENNMMQKYKLINNSGINLSRQNQNHEHHNSQLFNQNSNNAIDVYGNQVNEESQLIDAQDSEQKPKKHFRFQSEEKIKLFDMTYRSNQMNIERKNTQKVQFQSVKENDPEKQRLLLLISQGIRYDIEKIRKDITKKRKKNLKIYHEEMSKPDYWEKNSYKGFKGFIQQVKDMKNEYDNDKLSISCSIIHKAKHLKIKKLN
ncbi:UNKNOWN [Stylonychia lemnae]|uniref:Uncharacterized protein n=1 Tax=Stylonychia lemnae TaxID=5949 RepID=A0A078A4P0_STYLE|nr:UNKNOWN [Stylonychia lemnae]|eukprot:CDW75729.1 UNKNOWN [Stylonychia lemnae]